MERLNKNCYHCIEIRTGTCVRYDAYCEVTPEQVFVIYKQHCQWYEKCIANHIKDGKGRHKISDWKNWRIIRLKTETNEGEIDVFKDPYKEIKKEDEWRVGMIKEIIENKWGNLYSGLSFDELEYISSYICRS